MISHWNVPLVKPSSPKSTSHSFSITASCRHRNHLSVNHCNQCALSPLSLSYSRTSHVHKSPQRPLLYHRSSKVNTMAPASPWQRRLTSHANLHHSLKSLVRAFLSRREAGVQWLCDSVREVPECSSDSFSDCPPSAISSFWIPMSLPLHSRFPVPQSGSRRSRNNFCFGYWVLVHLILCSYRFACFVNCSTVLWTAPVHVHCHALSYLCLVKDS